MMRSAPTGMYDNRVDAEASAARHRCVDKAWTPVVNLVEVPEFGGWFYTVGLERPADDVDRLYLDVGGEA